MNEVKWKYVLSEDQTLWPFPEESKNTARNKYPRNDATTAFATKDTGRPHSQSATDMLVSYYLGEMNTVPATQPNASAPVSPTTPIMNPAPNGTQTPAQPATYTVAQVSAHNSASSCWATMNGKVYDITAYLPYHPGGIGAITPYCGGDLTAAFVGLPHSQNAANLLASYYLGEVASVASTSASPSVPASSAPLPIAPPNYEDKEEDDD